MVDSQTQRDQAAMSSQPRNGFFRQLFQNKFGIEISGKAHRQEVIAKRIVSEEAKKAVDSQGDNVDVSATMPNVYFKAAKRITELGNADIGQQLYIQGLKAADAAQKSAANLNKIKAETNQLNEPAGEYLNVLNEREAIDKRRQSYPAGSPTRTALDSHYEALDNRLNALNDLRGGSAGAADIESINKARKQAGDSPMSPKEVETYLHNKQMTGSIEQAYREYVTQGGKDSFDTYRQRFAGQQAASTDTGKMVVSRLDKQENDAQEALQAFTPIGNAVAILNKGIIQGSAAEGRVGIARFFDTVLGRDTDESALAQNTDAYVANAGKLVAAQVKSFGSGTSITDSDREYAKSIAGGNINMSDPALRSVLEHLAQAQAQKINRYNETLNKIGSDKDYHIYGDLYHPIDVPAIDFKKPKLTKPQPGASADELAQYYLRKAQEGNGN